MSRFRRRTGWVALVALLVPVAVSLALWLWQKDQADAAQDERAEDRAAVTAATRQTLNWGTVDYRKLDEFVRNVESGATGQFAQEFKQSEKPLRELVRANKSVQVPTIPKDGAALLERRGTEARVLVVVDANVSNKSTKTPQPRQYRLQVTVTKVDGEWLTSRLELIDATA